MISSLKIKDYFNTAEKTYDAKCLIQKTAGRILIRMLLRYKTILKNIIDLGCATGITTEALARRYKNVEHFYGIDIAPLLLLKANQRLHKFNIKLFEESFDDFHFTPLLFDLIFSNMSLQWSINLESTLLNLSPHLSQRGILAFSIPLKGTFKELNQEKILPLYEHKEIQTILNKISYQVLNTFEYMDILIFPSFIQALKSIKEIGAHYYRNKSPQTHLFHLRKSGHLPFTLTYKIGIFIAIKGA